MKIQRTPPEGVRVIRRTINYANGARIFTEPKGYANGARIFAIGDVGRQSRRFAGGNMAPQFGFGGTGRQFV